MAYNPNIPPDFVDELDALTILGQIVSYYEGLTGKTLQPGQTEMFILSAMAYRETLIRIQVQLAGEQNLIDFSVAPMLDYVCAMLGVMRLPATPDTVTVHYILTPGHSGVTIPAGHRIGSTDGQVIFKTLSDTVVPADPGYDSVDIVLQCQTTGFLGYAIGTISVIIDPLAFVVSAANTNISAGGFDTETDDALRARFKLAPGQFSNAGSVEAYKFWTRTANATIIDVDVTNPTPGTVNVYPLVTGGITTPSQVITEVENVLNAEKIRPLTDTVVVLSSTLVDFAFVINYTLYTWADYDSTTSAIQAAAEAYVIQQKSKLGLDVVISQIVALASVPGVYEITITDLVADIIIANNEVSICTDFGLVFVGYNVG